MKPLILLAEDDERLAALVSQFLKQHEFDVVIESMGHNVLRQLKDLNPDALILDLGLPGKDGLEICHEAREFYERPILILTARDSDTDQVQGLEFGADDYVTKPAEPRVLLARVRALLRRANAEKPQDAPQIQHRYLVIDVVSREVRYHDESIPLTSHEFDLLLVFAEKAGEVLSREFLFNKIYGRAYDGLDRTIDVRISQLRKKFGDNLDNPEKLKTIWGRGYLFVSEAW